MENAAMATLEIAIDAPVGDLAETTRSGVPAGTMAEVRNTQELYGTSILTADLEAVARCYRAKALNRFAQDLFRRLRDGKRD